MQIPKVQKAARREYLFVLLGPGRIKAASKMLVKLTPGGSKTSRANSTRKKFKSVFHLAIFETFFLVFFS